MLSETERESVQQAIHCLNVVLNSLLAQSRAGAIDIHEPVVKVTEALEQLEEMLGPTEPAVIHECAPAGKLQS